MMKELLSDEAPRKDGSCVKAAWSRPILEEVDIVTATQAGGNALADQDPNMPSG